MGEGVESLPGSVLSLDALLQHGFPKSCHRLTLFACLSSECSLRRNSCADFPMLLNMRGRSVSVLPGKKIRELAEKLFSRKKHTRYGRPASLPQCRSTRFRNFQEG